MLSLSPRLSSLPPALRLAIGLWLAFAVAVGLRTLVSPEQHSVFPLFATASEHFWHNQSLYARYRPLDYFRYPPVFAVAFTALSAFGLTAGGIMWNWLNLGVYGWGLWRFRRDVLPGTWTPGREALFLTLGLIGGLRGLWNGQSNALAVGLVLLAAAAFTRRRWWSAAGLLATPVLLKLTPLVLAMLLCALWPRKLIARFLLALSVGLLLPFLVKAPGIIMYDYQDWLGHLLGTSSERWPGFRDAWTVWLAARHLLFGEDLALTEPLAHPLLYRLLQALAGLAVLAWCLWQQRRGLEKRWLLTLTLGMGSAWLMLFGPAVEHATYVFLAPFLAWAAVSAPRQLGSGFRRNPLPLPNGRGSEKEPRLLGSGFRVKPLPLPYDRGFEKALIAVALILVLGCGWGALIRAWPAAESFFLMALPLGTAAFTLWLIGYATMLVPAEDKPRLASWSFRLLDGVRAVGQPSKTPIKRAA